MLPCLLAFFPPSFFQLAKAINENFNITDNLNFWEVFVYSNLPVHVEYQQAHRWSMKFMVTRMSLTIHRVYGKH